MQRAEQGVRFWDVAEWFQHIEKAHGVHIKLVVVLPVWGIRDKCLTMRLSAVKKGVGKEEYSECGVSCPWPNTDSATMAGAWLKLALQLDEMLTEEAKRDARRLSQLELF